jgi:hypothetical protein
LDKLNAVSQAEESKTPVAPSIPGVLSPTSIDIAEPEDQHNGEDMPMSELERMEHDGMYSALSDDRTEEQGDREVHEGDVRNQAVGIIEVPSGVLDVSSSAAQPTGPDAAVTAGTGAEAGTQALGAEGVGGVRVAVGGMEDSASRQSVEGDVPINNTSYTDVERANQGAVPVDWEAAAPAGVVSSQVRGPHQGDGEGARERGRRSVRQDRRGPSGQRAFDNIRYRANDDIGSEENDVLEREGGELYSGSEDFDVDYAGEEEEYEFDSADDDDEDDEEDDDEDEDDEDEEEDDNEGDDDSDNEGGDAVGRGIDAPTDEDREVKLINLQHITYRIIT